MSGRECEVEGETKQSERKIGKQRERKKKGEIEGIRGGCSERMRGRERERNE